MIHAATFGRIDWLPRSAVLIAAGLLAGCVANDPYYYEPYPQSGYYYYYAPNPPPPHYWHWRYRPYYGSYLEYRHFP